VGKEQEKQMELLANGIMHIVIGAALVVFGLGVLMLAFLPVFKGGFGFWITHAYVLVFVGLAYKDYHDFEGPRAAKRFVILFCAWAVYAIYTMLISRTAWAERVQAWFKEDDRHAAESSEK
jgi:hypothetical protein